MKLRHTSFSLSLIPGAILALGLSQSAFAQALIPGDLLVTTTTYDNTAPITAGVTVLPGGGGATAVASGNSLSVFNNATPDASFGITTPIYVDQFGTDGSFVSSMNVTALAAQQGINLTTSFSSKSELAINVSTDGSALTFMGYMAPVNTLDVSNSNTPGNVDPTNPVASSYSRAVAQLNLNGTLEVTPDNAYSGNNGRAAILANGQYYTVGNAGNGSGTEPSSIVSSTGVQAITPGSASGASSVIGVQQGTAGSKNGFQYGYSVTQNSYAADKSGKDNNFRGETVYNGTLYVTKGSGSNGINSVYQVGPTGALNNGGTLPSNASVTILPGFSTTLASASSSVQNPFGIWFANSTTLFVADEGDGKLSDAASSTIAGLSEYTFNGTTWVKQATFQDGLGLGSTVYSASGSQYVGGSYTTVTDGLRNITGQVNANGTYTLYGVTSTANNGGIADAGADPNKLVSITIDPNNLASASFTTLDTAAYGSALRGVALDPVPEPESYAMMLAGLGLLGFMVRRKKAKQQ